LQFGGVMHLPALVVLAITLAFPTALAWSAASVGAALRSLFSGKVNERDPLEANRAASSAPSSAPEVAVADV
jgi:hypothetical protein